jgi:hypothetical protein
MPLSSGGGTWGTSLYTVRGMGSGSRDVDAWTQTSLYAEDRGLPSTDDPGAWQYKCFFRSYDLLDWSTLSLSGNKTHLLNKWWLYICDRYHGTFPQTSYHQMTSVEVSSKSNKYWKCDTCGRVISLSLSLSLYLYIYIYILWDLKILVYDTAWGLKILVYEVLSY